jgi:hypothetical protein
VRNQGDTTFKMIEDSISENQKMSNSQTSSTIHLEMAGCQKSSYWAEFEEDLCLFSLWRSTKNTILSLP